MCFSIGSRLVSQQARRTPPKRSGHTPAGWAKSRAKNTATCNQLSALSFEPAHRILRTLHTSVCRHIPGSLLIPNMVTVFNGKLSQSPYRHWDTFKLYLENSYQVLSMLDTQMLRKVSEGTDCRAFVNHKNCWLQRRAISPLGKILLSEPDQALQHPQTE